MKHLSLHKSSAPGKGITKLVRRPPVSYMERKLTEWNRSKPHQNNDSNPLSSQIR